MTDARPKHKPNEKHTLDEVLKSLKDLVHGEVLDQPAPPAAPPTKAAEPAPPMADMRDIISSLEDLLESDLNLEEKVERAKAALAPVTQPRDRDTKPKAAAKPAPTPEAPQTRLALAPAEPKPAPPPTRPAVPPPPVTPMFDAEDNLEFDIDATPTEAAAPVEFPEEMSDDDIAKALAEIQTEMDAAPAAQPEPEPEIEFIDAESAPQEEIAIDAAPPPSEPAPPLELAIEEPAELAQRDLSLEPAFAPPDTSGLSVVEDEPTAVPEATPAGELTVSELAADTTAEEIIAPAAPTPEDGDFDIDFAPRKPPPPTEPDHVEDLAPPPWEDDGTIDRAEPPTTSGDVSGGSLGESVELDLSISDTVGDDAPRPDDAIAELAPKTEVIVTEIIAPPAPTEPEVATTPTPAKKELKVVEPDTEIVATEVIAPPEPEPVAPLTPAKKELKIVEPDAPPAKKPKPPAAKPAGGIPVLKDVAVAPPAASPPPAPAPESFTLELTPATPPKPAPPQDLHQMAVRIIAKLNIEMRKAGKPPLDVKTINRLQQLLKEALEKK